MTSAHDSDTDEEFLAPVEAYRLLDVSARTFRRYRQDGRIRPAYVLPGGHARFRRSDVLALTQPADAAADAGYAAARVLVVLAGTAVFGTLLGVATVRPLLVLSLLASVLVVGALGVVSAAAVAVVPEVLGALVDEARIRHRAGMARLRGDAMRRHPAGTAR